MCGEMAFDDFRRTNAKKRGGSFVHIHARALSAHERVRDAVNNERVLGHVIAVEVCLVEVFVGVLVCLVLLTSPRRFLRVTSKVH